MVGALIWIGLPLVGFVTGRWLVAALLPPTLWTFHFIGLGLGWWPPGTGEGWEATLVIEAVVGTILTAIGVGARRYLARFGPERVKRALAPSGRVLVFAASATYATLFVAIGPNLWNEEVPQGSLTVEELRVAEEPVLFPGESFEGAELTHVSGSPPSPLELAYGPCRRPVGIEYGTCEFELLFLVDSVSDRPPGFYPDSPCRRLTVLGAPAEWFAEPGALAVYTGDTTITFFAEDVETALDAANSLRDARTDEVVGQLPPSSYAGGRARCE